MRQHDYYLMNAGRQVVHNIVSTAPEFIYYVDRVALVIALADGLGAAT